MSKKEECEYIESQRKHIEPQQTKMLEEAERLSEEDRKLIRETMMFEEEIRKDYKNIINNEDCDTNSDETELDPDSNPDTETDMLKEVWSQTTREPSKKAMKASPENILEKDTKLVQDCKNIEMETIVETQITRVPFKK